ncbi:MAG TPA: K(+)-transporting ATPase subunit F [Pirellulales bacterium]|nr:K(+)-transporting ATPase subunit F [Pirellulales bacterium]
MNWIHIMATIVSVSLFVYLTVALLVPEKFS